MTTDTNNCNQATRFTALLLIALWPMAGVATDIANGLAAGLTTTGQPRAAIFGRFADTASYPDDGNQRYDVRARLTEQRRIDVQLGHEVEHIIGIAPEQSIANKGGGLVFLVTLANGAQSWLHIDPEGEAAVRPALERRRSNRFSTVLDGEPTNDAGITTSEGARLLAGRDSPSIELIGNELKLTHRDRQHVLATDALHDSRLHLDGRGRLLMLSKPSKLYGHAILGDGIEAQAVTIVSLTEARQQWQYPLAGLDVIEGRGAIWYDWDGKGDREIVVTAANDQEGARLVVLSPSRGIVAQSTPIGTGFRWRHMIGIAKTGTENREELVDVRTPHITGTVSFYTWRQAKLEEIASIHGYTSHRIGSPVLSMASLLNLDDDAAFEVLIPAQDRRRLVALKRIDNNVRELWSVPLTDRVTSNVAIVNVGGNAAVALGGERGLVSVWLP